MDKAELRAKHKKLRAELSQEERRKLDKAIFDRALKAVDWSHVKSLHVYVSKKHEADTSRLIRHIKKILPDIKISYPEEEKSREHYDVIIVPVVAFDSRSYRLGYGGGYYDKFLATQKQALKIGLAYGLGFVKAGLPSEPHDIPLSMVITEQRTYRVL